MELHPQLGNRTYAENVRRADAMLAEVEKEPVHLSDCGYVQGDRVRVTPLALAAATALAGSQRVQTPEVVPMPGPVTALNESGVFPELGNSF